jgi:hypothetical protein
VTTGFILITDADDIFPDEDFLPDISSLFDNMGDNKGTPNVNANTNMGSSSAPYVSLLLIIDFVLQFIILAIGLDMLDMFYSYYCKHGQFDFHVFSHIMFTIFMY